jgi:hypothetical protein
LGSKTTAIMPSCRVCYKNIWKITDACTEYANKTPILPFLLVLRDSSISAFPWRDTF